MPPVKKPRRVARTFRFPPALIERYEVRAAKLGMDRTTFVERALEAALGGDTRAASPAGRLSGQSHTEHHASATGAVTARGASRPAASPRAPVDAGADRAAAFRAAAARRRT